jgi:hypothetical protein
MKDRQKPKGNLDKRTPIEHKPILALSQKQQAREENTATLANHKSSQLKKVQHTRLHIAATSKLTYITQAKKER